MNSETNPLAGQRIGVFGRGGSGKSTCVVLLARALARAGYAVCVVDADSTNEGLTQAFGADKTPESLLDWSFDKVPDADTEHFLWQRLLEAEIQVTASIPDDPGLRQAWLEGAVLESAVGDAEAAKLVRALEEGRGGLGAAAGMTTTLAARTRGHPNARP
jgi:CO dehydrogenase nickel-insertion accessory protein CooC1